MIALAWLFTGAAIGLAEEIVLTTYLPSPRGVYEELRSNIVGFIDTASPPSLFWRWIRETDDTLRLQRTNAAGAPTAEHLAVASSGNVGIGMTSPGSRLVVQGAGSGSGSSGLNVTNAGGTSALFVRDDGRVGVGNSTTPTATLDVRGQVATNAGTAGSPAYSIVGDLNTGWFAPGGDTLAVATGGAERLRVTSGGDVGIGVSPGQRLDVSGGNALIRGAGGFGGAGNEGVLFLGDTNHYIKAVHSAGVRIGTWGVGDAITIAQGSGNVGVGVNPATKLDVNGTVKMTGFQMGTGAAPGLVLTALDASGNAIWAASPIPPGPTVYQCPDFTAVQWGCGGCMGQVTTNSTCFQTQTTANGCDRGLGATHSCVLIGRLGAL